MFRCVKCCATSCAIDKTLEEIWNCKIEFGTFIQNIRKQKKLEVRALAEQVGVDASTISRIENLHTQATVYTAFRICNGLGVTLSDLTYALSEKHLSRFYQNPLPIDRIDRRFIVNLRDVVSIVRSFKENRQNAIENLLEKINNLLKKYDEANLGHVSGHFTIGGFYSAGEIERYLFSSLLSEVYVLKHPPLSADLIVQIYQQEGAMTPKDVEVYLQQIRTRSRFLPTSSIEKMKINDVLRLLDRKGGGLDYENVVGMIWEACRFLGEFDKFNDVFDWKDGGGHYYPVDDRAYAEYRIAMFYVTLCRWELQIDTMGHVWIS